MKRILLMVLLLFSVTITACSAKDKTTEITKSAESGDLAAAEEETKPENKQSEEQKKEQTVLPDDLFSYQIEIDDSTYKFPMSFSEFTEKGWTFESDASVVLEESQYLSNQIWSKDGLKCNTYIFNKEKNGKPILDCLVAGIVLNGNELKSVSSTFTLPGNIQFQTSTKEDIIAAFGEPTRETVSGSILTYSQKTYCEVRFELDSDNKLNNISIQNMNN